MGCCMSTEHRRSQNENRRRSGGGALLPRSPPVEEAVKEVLSETRIVPRVVDGSKGTPPRDQAWKVDFGPPPALVRGNGNYTPPRRVNQERKGNGGGKEGEEIVSEASELFSYSGSYSNAAAAAAAAERRDKDNDVDGVVDQRLRPRKLPVPAARRGRGERVQGRKQMAASPERTGQVVPQRAGRGRSAAAGQPRNVPEERGPRRDPVEGSGRRSMTPDRRVDGRGRRNGIEEKSAAGRGPQSDAVKADEESLENPVVSLECFIFL